MLSWEDKMPDIRIETFDQVIDEIKPLLAMHWHEIASFKDDIHFAPDYARYKDIEEKGGLVILTAREGKELVGYSIFFLLQHPHYSTTTFAMNDILFVRPDKRGGTTGYRLIKESENAMKILGAKKISWHIKPAFDFSPALEKMGYVEDEINMAKIL